jgi:hypothetical protein
VIVGAGIVDELALKFTISPHEPLVALTVMSEGQLIAGNGFTVIAIEAVEVHPAALVPVTV